MMQAIISHTGADFDSLASMVAAWKLYPRARMFFTGSPEKNVQEFLSLYQDYFPAETAKAARGLEFTHLIIVDASVPARLGDFRDMVNDPHVVLHIYDHHPPSQESVVGDLNVIEEVGASTTILVRILMEKDIPITPMEATLFAIGIYEETGSLTFTDTTQKDIEVAAWLVGRGARLDLVSTYVLHSLSEEQRALLNELIINSSVRNIKGLRVLICRSDTNKYIDELALIIHRIMDLQRMDAVFAISRMRDRIYLVGRSQERRIDVASVLEEFSGGGHPTAASAVVKRLSMQEVESRLIDAIEHRLRSVTTARDVMTSPVHCLDIAREKTIADASNAFVVYGYSTMPVLDGGRLVGILTRRDVDKALNHGFARSPLSSYMNRHLVTAGANTSLPELRRIMIESGVGRIPIVDDGSLVGLVTRTDLLRALHGAEERPRPREIHPLHQLERLPFYLQEVLHRIGEVGDALGFNVYAVGGFVRDLLLGVENLDVDVVVEGDGIEFAENLARALGGRVKTHAKFGTGVVIAGSMRIDVATSRTEFYTRPAALPEVKSSSLKQDLFRRDFTINALALQLNMEVYGKLLDFFGARRDLSSGVIRVLHTLSFIDDPTRIFRAIRFEQRYGFRMDQSTSLQLREALKMNVLEKVSPVRVRDEIIQILSESRPLPALERMEELKILRLIHPKLHIDSRLRSLLHDVAGTLVQFQDLMAKERVKSWIVYFIALCCRLSPEEIHGIGERFRISRETLKKFGIERGESTRILRCLVRKDVTWGQVYELLENLSLEVLLYLIARTRIRSVKQKIALYLTGLRFRKPVVTGRDLSSWGYPSSPFFRKALRRLFIAQLDGCISNVDEARRFLEEHIVRNGEGD